MLCPKGHTAACIVMCCAIVLGLPSMAEAAQDLEVTDTFVLGGPQPIYYNLVVVKNGATLRVQERLHLRATRIIVESGGKIDASGQGYQGMDNLDGAGEMSGGGKRPAMSGPGGGGAYELHGGSGTDDTTCSVTAGSTGGIAYGDGMTPKPGSAGGAANVAMPGLGSRGGHGGGVMILEASRVEVYGELLARGEDGLVAQGMGSGGGAGGAIQIITNALQTGSNSRLSVRGGNGGDGLTNGGGGSGGLIVLTSNMPPTLMTEIGGGTPGSCMAPAGSGGTGELVNPGAPTDCMDVDSDGSASVFCPSGGADCDDGDPAVFPGALESCNGVDDDCSGMADDNLPAGACPAGQTCQSGACIAMPIQDAGTDAPSSEPPPDGIAFRGGCALGSGAKGTGAGLLTAFGFGLLAWSARARRRGRSRPAVG